ncbi:MAG: sugar transferase [Acidobacteriota bacterium]|nr:sugar transferase [Acidobacteriota bacterium]
MIRVFRVHLPARTLILAASEAILSVVLFALTVAASHGGAWPWLVYEDGFLRIGAVATIFLLCMYYYDLYDSFVLKSLREALTRLPGVLGTACLALAALYVVEPGIRLRLATVLLGMALVGFAIALVRRFFLAVTRSPLLAERFLLVGDGPLADALALNIERRPELGIRIVGTAGEDADSSAWAGGRIDGVILAPAGRWDGAGLARAAGVAVIDGTEFYEVVTGKVWLDALGAEAPIARRTGAASPLPRAATRVASFVVSFLALLFVMPFMAAIAAAIRFDSGGPVIFRQRRVGENGRVFTLYKFRSMRNGDHGPFRPASRDDERFTRVGRWLRRTRLDELPQLWNILRGDMSFVGPRPFAWEEERKWAREIPIYSRRWCVKPGVTGWAQIRRGYCATREDNVEKLAYDLFYVKNLSFGLDLLILFHTTKILLQGRGAR